jgi:hypothetical protein
MTDPHHSPQDLSKLIEQAEAVAVRQQRSRTKGKRSFVNSRLGTLVLLVALVSIAFAIRAMFAPPTEAQALHDLEAAVDKARQAVEAARARNGQLPDTLPSAALSSVVVYEHEQDSYSLNATFMGIHVTLQPDGKKTTETGANP